jgi:hypothetical protein
LRLYRNSNRILDSYRPHLVFAAVALLQFRGVVWIVYATGYALLAALAFSFVAGTVGVALLVHGAERDLKVAQPAE